MVFPDCLDHRVIEAAAWLKSEGLAEPVLIQSPFLVLDKARQVDAPLPSITVIDPTSTNFLKKNMEEYASIMRARGESIAAEKCRATMRNPLAAAAMMVRRGDVEIGLAGNMSSTAEVLRAGLSIIPKKRGIRTISSFFLMASPDGKDQYVFADCAVVPEPSADTLADIAISSAGIARTLLFEEPKVALLSFSTKGSSDHPRAKMVRDAVEKIRKRVPDLVVDGELQLDAAIDREVAALKAPGSIIEGRANVLIFPSLEAGNIAYKTAQRLAGYTAIGPFLQGFEGSWHDLSRGCSARDIFKMTLLGLCMQRTRGISADPS